MRRTLAATALLLSGLGAAMSASDPRIAASGDYVEVRTAEVFTGPCMLGSEADSLGREAIMAWRISRGSVEGVGVDGLSVVAVVAGDRNLGMHELGAPEASVVKSILIVDGRASAPQRDALVSLARALSPRLVRDVVEVRTAPITFERRQADVRVTAGDAALDVTTTFEHSPVCGAMQWFTPLAATEKPLLGFARANTWSGAGLDVQWTQTDRKSSFVGTFRVAGQ